MLLKRRLVLHPPGPNLVSALGISPFSRLLKYKIDVFSDQPLLTQTGFALTPTPNPAQNSWPEPNSWITCRITPWFSGPEKSEQIFGEGLCEGTAEREKRQSMGRQQCYSI